MRNSKIVSTLAALLLALGSTSAMSADIIIINFDGPGVGFNDPTPVAPVGGNDGATLGEQRQNVFNRAAQLWGARLESDALIFVGALFGPQECSPTGGVLASAGPTAVFRDAPEFPLAGTWYVGALADALSGADQDPGFIDIITRFNGDIGVNPDCLTGLDWYNGYDNNNAPNEFDLLTVVMHELSHGLGFLELASEATGAAFLGFPDAYLVNMADTTTGKGWADMTDAERLASQVNSGNLVWTGPSVTADAPNILGPRPSIKILNPKGLKGSYEVQSASYGPSLRENGGTTGKMVVVNDGVGVGSDGCEPIQNKIKGKIAVIDRGACAFTTKTANAQLAGAKGVVVVNNQPGGPAPVGGADNPFFAISTVGVTMALGDAMKAAAAKNSVAKLILDGNFKAGTQDGFVRLYAPNPVAPGSSKSHFDVSATPNLLMEPFISDDLASAVFVDLTTNVFEDIGWVLQ
ncbi:MAG: PA domain-containing protein [Woeseiaceae bacterium]